MKKQPRESEYQHSTKIEWEKSKEQEASCLVSVIGAGLRAVRIKQTKVKVKDTVLLT